MNSEEFITLLIDKREVGDEFIEFLLSEFSYDQVAIYLLKEIESKEPSEIVEIFDNNYGIDFVEKTIEEIELYSKEDDPDVFRMSSLGYADSTRWIQNKPHKH